MKYKARVHVEYLRDFLSNDEMIYDPPFGGKFTTSYLNNLIVLTHNDEFEFEQKMILIFILRIFTLINTATI